MKKVIAFSLWGNDSRYTGGALQNVSLASIFYPDWICRFYVGKSTLNSTEFMNSLKSNDKVEIIEMEEEGNWTGMFWRFYSAADPTVDVMISRDTDSRLGFREKAAVDEWLESDKDFHIMRDHPYHGTPILGGMWGVKGKIISDIEQISKDYKPGNFLQTDQIFLRNVIYPKIKHTTIVHDEFFEKINFPQKSGSRDINHFVGQAYDGNGLVLDVKNYGIQSYKEYLKSHSIEWNE